MKKTLLSRRAAMTLPAGPLALALSGCGDTNGKAKFTGTPIPVLPEANILAASPNAPPVNLPPPAPLPDWPQVLANPAHAPGNVVGPTGINQAWQAGIGTAGGYRQPLQASPIIAAGKVFTMDANGNVAAFSLRSGNELWRCYTRPKHNSEQNLSGGIAYANGSTLDDPAITYGIVFSNFMGSGVYTFVMTAKKAGQADIHVSGKIGVVK